MNYPAKSTEGLGLDPSTAFFIAGSGWIRYSVSLSFSCSDVQCNSYISQGSRRVDGSAPSIAHSKPRAQWVATVTLTFNSKPTLHRSCMELLIEKPRML